MLHKKDKMKKIIFSLLTLITLIILLFINYKVFISSNLQAFLMYDYNTNEYNFPYEDFSEELDDDFPNLSDTTMPIKLLKARYLMNVDSLDSAKNLLYKAIDDNPYIMAPQEMLARIYIDEKNYDSAYYFSKAAFQKMPNVNPHRFTYFKVLRNQKNILELDSAFKVIKYRGNKNHWYDYLFTRTTIQNDKQFLDSLVNEFRDLFPKEDTLIINRIKNRIDIGAEAYSLSALLSSVGDDYFRNEEYKQAAEFYEKSIDFNKDNYLLYENAAISFDLSNQFEKASYYYNYIYDNFKVSDGRSEYYNGLMLIRNNDNIKGCDLLRKAYLKGYQGKTTKIRAIDVYLTLCQPQTSN